MLMAIAIIFRAMLAINITKDLRITFAFLGTMAIGMLFGPVVNIFAAIGIDVIGYILDGYKMREYNFGLLAVKILLALVVGSIMYNAHTKSKAKFTAAVIGSRLFSVLIGQIVLNSCILYKSYTNPKFPFMSHSEWTAFWTWLSIRINKNLIMLPFEIIAAMSVLPIIAIAFKQVFRSRKTA